MVLYHGIMVSCTMGSLSARYHTIPYLYPVGSPTPVSNAAFYHLVARLALSWRFVSVCECSLVYSWYSNYRWWIIILFCQDKRDEVSAAVDVIKKIGAGVCDLEVMNSSH